MNIRSYAEAGVDIEKGDKFSRFIASIKSKAVSGDIGGFAGGVEIDLKNTPGRYFFPQQTVLEQNFCLQKNLEFLILLELILLQCVSTILSCAGHSL